MNRILPGLALALAIAAAGCPELRAEDVTGRVLSIERKSRTRWGSPAIAVLLRGTNGLFRRIYFIESATLSRRQLNTRLAVLVAANRDPANNPVTITGLRATSRGLEGDPATTLSVRFNSGNRWTGVTPGGHSWSHYSYSGQSVAADAILGIGVAKEVVVAWPMPTIRRDIEWIRIRSGNLSWDVVLEDSSSSATLDTNVHPATDSQREHILTLAAQYSGRMVFNDVRMWSLSGYHIHRDSEVTHLE